MPMAPMLSQSVSSVSQAARDNVVASLISRRELLWREADPPDHHDDKVDSDQ